MRLWFRIVVAAMCLAIVCWAGWSIKQAFATTADQITMVDDSHGRAEETLSFARQDADRLFQIVILVLGALIALAIVDKEHRLGIKDYPEILMCLVSAGLLVGFLFFFHHFDELIKEVYWDIGVLAAGKARDFPDFLHSPYINLHYQALLRCFYAGLIASGLTTFSLCSLRKETAS